MSVDEAKYSYSNDYNNYIDDVQKEYDRIKDLGYTDFKLKNGQIVYEVEGEKLFKIKAPEGTEIEIRDTDI